MQQSPLIPSSDKNVVGDGEYDKVTSGNKDLSHSIRGEAVFGRSKDKNLSQLSNWNLLVDTPNKHSRPQYRQHWLFQLKIFNFGIEIALTFQTPHQIEMMG